MLIYFIFRQKKRVEKLKEVSLSKDATPTINSFVTGSEDIHVDSVRQVTKFGKDIKTGRWKTKKTS
jgi:hypothetical protein